MPKHILIPRLFVFSAKTILTVIFFMLLLTTSDIQGQSKGNTFEQAQNSKPSQSARELLPNRLGARWQAVGPAQVFDARRLFSSLPDADVHREYGLQRVINRVYADGRIRTSVEVFEMNFISNAYGLFTFNRGHLPPNSHEFYEGRYVVRASSDGNAQLDRSIFEAIKPNLIGGEGQLPSLPLHLPEAGKIADSEKYIVGPAALAKLKNFSELKNAINFGVGVEIVTSEYNSGSGQMSLMIIEYQTPQLASDVYAQIQSYFDTLPQIEKDRRILKRVGNYVVAAVNIQDMPEAQNIVGQIKYQTRIYWAGRKLSDIPLEYRPPDPVAIEEAVRTIQILHRSFYWMGAMLLSAIFLGLVAGGVLFGWNLYRRRKLGLDNMFSDAGGSIRLNLDGYLLSDDPKIKQIDKGDK